jgi:hypothetical protein
MRCSFFMRLYNTEIEAEFPDHDHGPKKLLIRSVLDDRAFFCCLIVIAKSRLPRHRSDAHPGVELRTRRVYSHWTFEHHVKRWRPLTVNSQISFMPHFCLSFVPTNVERKEWISTDFAFWVISRSRFSREHVTVNKSPIRSDLHRTSRNSTLSTAESILGRSESEIFWVDFERFNVYGTCLLAKLAASAASNWCYNHSIS